MGDGMDAGRRRRLELKSVPCQASRQLPIAIVYRVMGKAGDLEIAWTTTNSRGYLGVMGKWYVQQSLRPPALELKRELDLSTISSCRLIVYFHFENIGGSFWGNL